MSVRQLPLLTAILLFGRAAAPQTSESPVPPKPAAEESAATTEEMAEAEESGAATEASGGRDVNASSIPTMALEPVEKVDEGIEEIIVTATKRETRLQETAVAVTALTDESLERQQVVDLKSVTALVPNLQIGAHSDSAAIDVSLRGIVSTNRTELGDPAVAFHVDGFYSPRPQGATTLLYDLERIEVLRGPQGTLFGRNANAGVINVSTAKPSFDAASASADMTVGDYDLFRIKGHLNAPISERFAIRGAVYADRRDGFIKFQPGSKVPVGADRYDNSDKTSYRLSALWEPLDNLRIFLSGEQFVDTGAGTIPVLIDPREGTALRSALVDSAGELDMRNTTFHGRIDYRPIPWLELSYLGGYGRMTRKNVSDNDAGFNPGENFQQEHRTEWSKFLSQSHELQIKTVDTEYIDAIVGGFYYREDNKIRFDIDINDDPDGDLIPNRYWAMSFIQPERILDSLAAFGQVTWHAMDFLRLTGGARYSQDTKSDEGGLNLVCPTFPDPNDPASLVATTFGTGGVNLKDVDGLPMAPDIDAGTPYPDGTCGSFAHNDVEKTWSKVTWMGRVEVDPVDNLLVYGLVNTGFKSGVIQDGGTTADPEYVTNYELGAKATLLGGRLNINPVAFYSDYTDILRSRAELQEDGSQQLVTRNATEARIFGVETEVTWFASAADLLQLMVSYLNAEYEDFPNIDNVYYATDDPLSPVDNLKGNKLPFSPEFSVAAAYEHSFELGNNASIVPRIQTQFQTEMYLNDFNRDSDRQKAVSRTDLSIRYVTQSGWIAEIFVKNVEDSAVKSNVEIKGNSPGGGGVPGDPGYAFAYYDAPRTFGARLSYTWQDL